MQLNATGATTYIWSPNIGLSCTDCPDPVASPTTTTTYRVIGHDPSGCIGEDSVTVTIAPTFTVEAWGDTTMCVGGTAMLHGGTDAVSWSWSPSEGVDCPTCLTTAARPTTTTRYYLRAEDKEGCTAVDSVDVIMSDASMIIRATVDRGQRLVPASEAAVAVRLMDRPDPAGIEEFRMTVRFDPQMIRMDELDLRSSLLDGWSVEEKSVDNVRGEPTARLRAPIGGKLRGDGVLLWLRLRGYLGSVDSSEPGLRIDLSDAECTVIETSPGLIRIDSICGLSLRLIEGNAEGYALEPNRPNPFNPTTELEFSLGLDGATKLEIRDAGGRLTALLVDEMMEAGKYIVTWDAANQASGVYYYRLTSGAWSRTGVMTLMK